MFDIEFEKVGIDEDELMHPNCGPYPNAIIPIDSCLKHESLVLVAHRVKYNTLGFINFH